MARFRHLHAAEGLDLDWRQNDKWSSGTEARLENGDWISVKPHRGRWEYHLYGPPMPHDHPEHQGRTGVMFFTGYGDKPAMSAEILGRRTGADGLGSHGEAQRAAEEHYKSLDRRGAAPPARDYDINDIMRKFDGGGL
jgi:hypothetical protein